jgi:probable O-glycosylation ligase (exosortase A-associated)
MLRTIFVAILALVLGTYAVKGAFEALLFYLWIAYFRPESWVWNGDWLRVLNLSFVAGLYLLVRSLRSDAKPRFTLQSALLGLFFVLSLASTLESKYTAYAWPFWVELAKTLTVSFLLAALTTDQSRYRSVVLAIALSLGFEGAKQGWASMILHPGAKNLNYLPSLGDENGVAVFMLMLASLFIALAQTATKRWERWMHRFFTVGVIYRAISTYSRGGFLAAGTMVAFYLLRTKNKIRSCIGAAMVAGIVLSVLPQTFWDRMSTIHVAEDDLEDDSARSRLHFWRVAVAMANDNPIFGVGHNAYNIAYDTYDSSHGRYGSGRSVHSSWFGVMAELGYPAFVVYVLMLVLAFFGSGLVARRAKRGKAPPELYHYAAAIQTAFAVFIVGGSFVPSQYTEMLWHFFGLSMALRAIATETAPAAAPQELQGFQAPSRLRPQPAMEGA